MQEGDAEREVTRMHDGEVFGEISLLTGEKRNATIVAITNVELLATRERLADRKALVAQNPRDFLHKIRDFFSL